MLKCLNPFVLQLLAHFLFLLIHGMHKDEQQRHTYPFTNFLIGILCLKVKLFIFHSERLKYIVRLFHTMFEQVT